MHQQLCWMKHKLTVDVLELGFHIITTDNDVAFMRKIWPSVHGIFEVDRKRGCLDVVTLYLD